VLKSAKEAAGGRVLSFSLSWVRRVNLGKGVRKRGGELERMGEGEPCSVVWTSPNSAAKREWRTGIRGGASSLKKKRDPTRGGGPFPEKFQGVGGGNSDRYPLWEGKKDPLDQKRDRGWGRGARECNFLDHLTEVAGR